jgi:hypothetical protein
VRALESGLLPNPQPNIKKKLRLFCIDLRRVKCYQNRRTPFDFFFLIVGETMMTARQDAPPRMVAGIAAAMIVSLFVAACDSNKPPAFPVPAGQGPQAASKPDAGSGFVLTLKFKELQKLEGQCDTVKDVVFSLDGTRLVSAGSDSTIRAWDTGTWKETAALRIGEFEFVAISALPGGIVVLTNPMAASESASNRLTAWDMKSPEPAASIAGEDFGTAWSGGLASSPDGRRLAIFGNGASVRILDAASLKEIKTLSWPVPPPKAKSGERARMPRLRPAEDGRDIAYAMNGTKLVVRTIAAVHIWDSTPRP